MDLRDLVSGAPSSLRDTINGAASALEGLQDELKNLGESYINTTDGEEEKTGEFPSETGGPARKVRWFQPRKAQKKLKDTEAAGAISAFGRRLNTVESAMKDMVKTIKVKQAVKSVGTGNRAIFSCQITNVAAGATTASGNVVANAATYYDRVAFTANASGVITTVRAAGNQVIDGSDALAVADGKPFGPIEMAEPIQLAGTSGASASFTNRSAAPADASVVFVPVGHSWGSANPGAF